MNLWNWWMIYGWAIASLSLTFYCLVQIAKTQWLWGVEKRRSWTDEELLIIARENQNLKDLAWVREYISEDVANRIDAMAKASLNAWETELTVRELQLENKVSDHG